jgi:ribokinase
VRVAVVGHVEWGTFARVARFPSPGEILHAEDAFDEAGGGGAVAAVQLVKLGAEVDFFCALGDDDVGARARARLEGLGVRVWAAVRPRPHRRVLVLLDPQAERTIIVLGARLWPERGDPLPWERLTGAAGVYVTAGDAGALAAARAAGVLVATARARDTLQAARVPLDALVFSEGDPGERVDPAALHPRPRLALATRGAQGGRWQADGGETGTWRAARPPGPPADAYGCGDSFAAALTFALAGGRPLPAALELAARCGAACLTGAGPYAGQLDLRRPSGTDLP